MLHIDTESAFSHLLARAFGAIIVTRDGNGIPIEEIRLLRQKGLSLAEITRQSGTSVPDRPPGRRQVGSHARASEAGRRGAKGSCVRRLLVRTSGSMEGRNGPVRSHVLAGTQTDRTESVPLYARLIGFARLLLQAGGDRDAAKLSSWPQGEPGW